MLQTERLKIYLASEREMQEFIDNVSDAQLKTAYMEMLNGAIENPKEKEFYAMWFIKTLKGEHVGEMCFKGIKNGETEIGYGIRESFQHKGYGTESVKALTTWALSQKNVRKVFAEVEKDNVYSVKLLERIGFIKTKISESDNLIYEKT